jgi:hypothetical protein
VILPLVTYWYVNTVISNETKLIKMIIQLSRGNEAKISVSYLNVDFKWHNVNITPIGLWNVEKNDRSSRSWHH